MATIDKINCALHVSRKLNSVIVYYANVDSNIVQHESNCKRRSYFGGALIKWQAY